MSHIDNLILCLPGWEERDESGWRPPLERGDHTNSVARVGWLRVDCIVPGYAMETNVWVGAGNYVDMDRLCAALRADNFSEPENVQLFRQGQEGLKFTEVDWRNERNADPR